MRRALGLGLLVCAAAVSACGRDAPSESPSAVQGTPTAVATTDGPSDVQTTEEVVVPTVAVSEPSRAERVAALKPDIVERPIPLTAERRADTEDYAMRHYGLRRHVNARPRVIVQHVTVTPDVQSVFRTFEPNTPDVSLRELPGLCTQFVIDRDGTIYQLTPITFMCRHVVGLNHQSIGIEHVGRNDAEVLQSAPQMEASLRLTQWLRCRFRIAVPNVIGHSESLESPYHEERVAALRTYTHVDWSAENMRGYRSRLREAGACPG